MNRFEALRELDQVADQEGDAIEEVDERHSDLMSEEDGRSVSGEDSIVGASEADQEAVVHDPTLGEAPVEFIPETHRTWQLLHRWISWTCGKFSLVELP